MKSGFRIAVVIPCYRVAPHVADVLSGLPEWIDEIIAVDDACPEGSGAAIEAAGDARVTLLRHETNQGVGGAVMTGYRAALERGADVVVKLDGDGQMDPGRIEALIAPLLDGSADYAKGNRFRDFAALRDMPRMRLVGNSAMSFLVKAASGYWNVMDPANGFTAITAATLARLDLDRLDRRYFFESDMLCQLYLLDTVVADVAMPARYGEEDSSLSLLDTAMRFPGKLACRLVRRVFLSYFVHDFNMASVYLLSGLPMFLFGIVFGLLALTASLVSGEPRSIGTALFVLLPLILGFQMLLQAVAIDIASVPKRDR